MTNLLATRALIIFLALLTIAPGPSVRANPIENFFKKLGNSIAHPHRQPTPRPTPKKKKAVKSVDVKVNNVTPPPYLEPTPETVSSAFTPQPSTTPEPVPMASASSVVVRGPRQDFPYGIPVANKPGFVTSPFAPKAGFVDVRGFASGTEVKDPFTGKVFLTP